MAVPSIASVPGPSIADPHRPLKVGMTVPVQEGELAVGTTRWPDIVEFARVADDVGFDSLANDAAD